MHLYTVRQFADTNPAFSESSVRWLVFKAKANGLDESGAILRNGRRVLIDGDKFESWLKSRQAQAGGAR